MGKRQKDVDWGEWFQGNRYETDKMVTLMPFLQRLMREHRLGSGSKVKSVLKVWNYKAVRYVPPGMPATCEYTLSIHDVRTLFEVAERYRRDRHEKHDRARDPYRHECSPYRSEETKARAKFLRKTFFCEYGGAWRGPGYWLQRSTVKRSSDSHAETALALARLSPHYTSDIRVSSNWDGSCIYFTFSGRDTFGHPKVYRRTDRDWTTNTHTVRYVVDTYSSGSDAPEEVLKRALLAAVAAFVAIKLNELVPHELRDAS